MIYEIDGLMAPALSDYQILTISKDGSKNKVMYFALDVTYSHTQESADNEKQRAQFSQHKNHYVQGPFLVCAIDGYKVSIHGPFDAMQNYASILDEIIQSDNKFTELITPNEKYVVLILGDRCFRDTVHRDTLTKFEVHFFTPDLDCSPTILPTLRANESRFITKLRRIIEQVNGVLKICLRYLANIVPNKSIRHLNIDFRADVAFYHTISKPISFDKHDELEISREIKKIRTLDNIFVEKSNQLDRKKVIWDQIEAKYVDDFPILSFHDVKMTTFGTSQIIIAKSYISEHMQNNEGLFLIEIIK